MQHFYSTALAEILSVKDIPGKKLYYVHYIDCKYIMWQHVCSQVVFYSNWIHCMTGLLLV